MKAQDLDKVREDIEAEGFDYAFTGYSDYDEIQDGEFHRLREEFLAARKKLVEYLGVEDC